MRARARVCVHMCVCVCVCMQEYPCVACTRAYVRMRVPARTQVACGMAGGLGDCWVRVCAWCCAVGGAVPDNLEVVGCHDG